ncbi:MAG: hypothetical protein J0L75_07320 [Spirochaetes bacterium]|nr:hypothetical protein [Spirochaetota bacterium]
MFTKIKRILFGFKAIRIQIFNLTVDDLRRYPIWEYAHDEEHVSGTDEATVRPICKTNDLSNFKRIESMAVIRTIFTVKNGTQYEGYSALDSDEQLSRRQPVIVVGSNQIGFWHGVCKPSEKEITDSYELLGYGRENIFPIHYETIEINNVKFQGTIPAFLYLNDSMDVSEVF